MDPGRILGEIFFSRFRRSAGRIPEKWDAIPVSDWLMDSSDPLECLRRIFIRSRMESVARGESGARRRRPESVDTVSDPSVTASALESFSSSGRMSSTGGCSVVVVSLSLDPTGIEWISFFDLRY